MRAFYAALLALILVILSACASRSEGNAQTKNVHKETERTTSQVPVTAPDGSVSLVTVVTVRELVGTDESVTNYTEESHTAPDGKEIATVVAPVAQMVAGASGLGWVNGAMGLVTLVATTLAGHKAAQASTERKRADEHKADADEGWAKALSPDKATV